MKKLLLGAVATTLFSASMLIFQASCKKDATAQTNPNGTNYTLPAATTSTLGGVMVDGTTIKIDGTGKISAVTSSAADPGSIILYSVRALESDPDEMWRVGLDGSNKQKINITMPAGIELDLSDGGAMKLTPDNKKIIFMARKTTTNQKFIYSCNIDGSNVVKLVDGPDTEGRGIELGSVN